MLILCTGASGIVGYNFVKVALKNGHKVIALTHEHDLPDMGPSLIRHKIDLQNEYALQRVVLDNFPDAIVHCAAISSPDFVDTHKELAEKINVGLTRSVAHCANHVSARLIHISTDMVFDGTAAPYKNTDIPKPFNFYGQTKLEAEKEVLRIMAAQSVVLRISHVSGNSLTQARSLHEKFMLRWAAGERIALAENDTRAPCSAERLADVICEILERPNISGIHHFCGLESLSRYDMGVKICERFGLDKDKFVEKISLDKPINLTLDMGALASKLKTMSLSFDSCLSEMEVPDSIKDWYEAQSGRKVIKRFKL